MKKVLLFTVSCLLYTALSGQDLKVTDSLRKALQLVELQKGDATPDLSDSTRANIIYQLSFEYRSSNLDTSLSYAQQALSLSQAINYLKGIGNGYNGIGVVYWYRGQYERALEYFQLSLQIRQQTGDKKTIAGSYNNIGLIYHDQGNHPEALKNYFSSLKLYEEMNDKEGIAQEYSNIGTIYSDQHNPQEALKFANKAKDIRIGLNDKWGLTESYSNIGLINFELGNYIGAMTNYNEALKLRIEIGDKEGIAISYNNFGDVYKKEGNYKKALESYLKALDIDREMGLRKSMADVYLSIGVLFEEQNNLQEAVRYETMALAVAQDVGALDYMKKAYGKLALAHAKMKDYKEAYRYKVLHEAASDSLFNTEKNKTLLKLQLQYDYDKKQLSDSLRFAQEKELTEVRLQRQRAYTYGGIAGIGLTALLLFVVYRNYSRQREANRMLKETQQQLIKSEKMAAFGVMASRVAHEIQNPLNFVNNFSELSQEQVREIIAKSSESQCQDTAKALLESLQKINHHGKRAGNIVRQLQELSRTGKAQKFFEEE